MAKQGGGGGAIGFGFDSSNDLTDRQPSYPYSYPYTYTSTYTYSYSPHHRVGERVLLRCVGVRFWAEPEGVRRPAPIPSIHDLGIPLLMGGSGIVWSFLCRIPMGLFFTLPLVFGYGHALKPGGFIFR